MYSEFRSYQFRPFSIEQDGTINRKLVETMESKYTISTVRPFGYLGEDEGLFPSETELQPPHDHAQRDVAKSAGEPSMAPAA